MALINVTELSVGQYFIDENNLYEVLKKDLDKTAMRKMIAKLKAKNLRTGSIVDISRNSGYMVDVIRSEKKTFDYGWDDGDSITFMNNETYEQIEISKDKLEWQKNFLVSGVSIDIEFYEGEMLDLVLPSKVKLQITECEPAVKGDTVNKAMKNATVETGYQVKVPLFIEDGEYIYVRTDNGEYDGRAN